MGDAGELAFRSSSSVISAIPASYMRFPTERQIRGKLHLTHAEARLATWLATGRSLRDTAKALGIKYETARTVLKVIFRKTHTESQVQLVLLLIRVANEIVESGIEEGAGKKAYSLQKKARR